MSSTVRWLLAAMALNAALPVLAQTISVTTPRLPPRGTATAAAQPGAYTSPTPQGNAGSGAATTPAAAAVAKATPQRAPSGACRAQPTPDRQTLVLVSGPDSLARAQLPLGEFRVQQVVHSPDGQWAVAFTKLRGVPQYAAMTIDLERCEVQRVIDLSAAGEDARFEAGDVVLRLSDGERRVALRDRSVR